MSWGLLVALQFAGMDVVYIVVSEFFALELQLIGVFVVLAHLRRSTCGSGRNVVW